MFEFNKTFLKKVLTLMAPIVLQNLITVGVNFMDNLMIGPLGEISISAAAFSNQFYSLFQFISMGLGSGAIVMSSQFWGRKETEPMRRVAAIALRLTFALGAAFTLLSSIFPQVVLGFFTTDAVIISTGLPYMRLIGLTFLLAGLTSTATYLLRSAGNVRISLISSSVAFFLNIFFNWMFIFGKLGAPRLDLVGAAVGTVIARVFECCFVFGYFILKDTRFGFRAKHFFLSGGNLWRTYFKYGIPVLVSDFLLGLSIMLIGVVIGHMGQLVSSANSMVSSMSLMLNVFSMGLAGAGAVMVGNTIGEGDIPKAKRQGNSCILLCVLTGAVLGVLMMLVRPLYFSAYEVQGETLAMAEKFLLITALCYPLTNMANGTSKGVLRGGGDSRFLLVADSACVWLISLPLGVLGAFVWGMSPLWVYFFLLLQHPLKGIICLIRYLSGKWVKVIKVGEKA